MNNKVLIFIAKLVGTVVVFFLCGLVFQYFDEGVTDYYKAINYALTRGIPICIILEIFDYYRNKKKK